MILNWSRSICNILQMYGNFLLLPRFNITHPCHSGHLIQTKPFHGLKDGKDMLSKVDSFQWNPNYPYKNSSYSFFLMLCQIILSYNANYLYKLTSIQIIKWLSILKHPFFPLATSLQLLLSLPKFLQTHHI